MKICTITCHDVYNYGASLQAYALQEYCRSLGHDYCIIDYKPPYLSNHYNLWSICNPIFDKPVVRELYRMAKLPGRLRQLKRKRLFDDFTKKYLSLTKKRYDSSEDIAEDCPSADLYIAGSDQIWNTLFPNGADAAFYLDFVKNGARKISYAASFATEKIHNGLDSFVKEKLKNFDAISVRESSALQILQKLDFCDATLLADPVFLLAREQWAKLIEKPISGNDEYIFVYDCEKSHKLRAIAEELRRKTGLKICSVSAIYGRYADKNYELSGPKEFLSLLANARYVLANSFHALAFSLIFQKDFYIVNRNEGINKRMSDLLCSINLSNRLVDKPIDIDLEAIQYQSVEAEINSLIDTSCHYLNQQIDLCQ
ncbi:MAG: polysaccharide pyruvyl transferase family protein [Muribaculaceae bacterium]|nr:polysaccharide pyruvyl transferase family protein [Muribaculaceae bacterium]